MQREWCVRACICVRAVAAPQRSTASSVKLPPFAALPCHLRRRLAVCAVEGGHCGGDDPRPQAHGHRRVCTHHEGKQQQTRVHWSPLLLALSPLLAWLACPAWPGLAACVAHGWRRAWRGVPPLLCLACAMGATSRLRSARPWPPHAPAAAPPAPLARVRMLSHAPPHHRAGRREGLWRMGASTGASTCRARWVTWSTSKPRSWARRSRWAPLLLGWARAQRGRETQPWIWAREARRRDWGWGAGGRGAGTACVRRLAGRATQRGRGGRNVRGVAARACLPACPPSCMECVATRVITPHLTSSPPIPSLPACPPPCLPGRATSPPTPALLPLPACPPALTSRRCLPVHLPCLPALTSRRCPPAHLPCVPALTSRRCPPAQLPCLPALTSRRCPPAHLPCLPALTSRRCPPASYRADGDRVSGGAADHAAAGGRVLAAGLRRHLGRPHKPGGGCWSSGCRFDRWSNLTLG